MPHCVMPACQGWATAVTGYGTALRSLAALRWLVARVWRPAATPECTRPNFTGKLPNASGAATRMPITASGMSAMRLAGLTGLSGRLRDDGEPLLPAGEELPQPAQRPAALDEGEQRDQAHHRDQFPPAAAGVRRRPHIDPEPLPVGSHRIAEVQCPQDQDGLGDR